MIVGNNKESHREDLECDLRIVALAGGVGGAKLADGLAQILQPGNLAIIVNTGDDFKHFGLQICPDLDTVCYTLAGFADPVTGWGRALESWQVLENATRLGGPGWFKLGDKDLGTHLERSRRLQEGQTLTQITHDFCLSWGISQKIIPMTNDPVHTIVETVEFGDLPFQEYFVKYHWQPRVKGFRFMGAESAHPAPGTLQAIRNADAVLICPSNPWVSIDPILSIAGIKSEIKKKCVIAVSPIVGGKTVRGPAAKMFLEMGLEPSVASVAGHYPLLLNGFVFDVLDAAFEEEIRQRSIKTFVTKTIMESSKDRRQLAQDVLNFVKRL